MLRMKYLLIETFHTKKILLYVLMIKYFEVIPLYLDKIRIKYWEVKIIIMTNSRFGFLECKRNQFILLVLFWQIQESVTRRCSWYDFNDPARF